METLSQKHQAIKLQLQGNPVSWKNKTKQNKKKKNPEASDHCKHLYVQILSLSKFECHRFAAINSLQISCESQILLKL